MTEKPLRETDLDNGVRIRVCSRTRKIADSAKRPPPDPRGHRRLEGDIWVVGLSIRATVDVAAALTGQSDLALALEVLGPEAAWERDLVRNLVHESEKPEKEAEVQKHLDTLLEYLARPAFPARLVRSEVKTRTSPAGGPWPRRPA
ncbi:MAG: hypothetical protein ABIM40_14620 [Pseudomonadota bacterium]